MTYAVIKADGSEPELRPGAPTPEELSDLVGGLPSPVRTEEGDSTVLWVNDDFAGLELPRNVLGTVFASFVGGPRQPYAGDIVVTGMRRDPMEGYLPVSLASDTAMALTMALHDAAVALGLPVADPEMQAEMPDSIRASLNEVAEFARTAPMPGQSMVVVSATSVDELLDMIGQVQRGETPPGSTVI